MPTPPFGRENTRRGMFESARWRDMYSFNGRGRIRYQKLNLNPITQQPEPEGPPEPGAVQVVRG